MRVRNRCMDRQSSSQPTGRTAVYGWSGPLDPGGIAAGGREVGMQIYRLGISEERADALLDGVESDLAERRPA